MTPLRRRRPPDPIVAAFDVLAGRMNAAQRALLAAIPTARDPGAPLAEALDGFAAWLAAAEALMPAWRDEGTAEMHDRCGAALAAARAEAERLRLEQTLLTFEGLTARVGDVLAPLEEFAETERALRRR